MSAGEAPAVPEARVTVFIVDDDDGLRRALSRLVRSAGWTVESFDSAHAFLERPLFHGVGCVIADVQMPGMSGLDMQVQMTARGIALPVVFLTAHGDLPTGISAMKRGAMDFLTKPVDEAQLLQAIHAALARHARAQRDQLRRAEIEARLATLSARERETLQFVVQGLLNKQIADRMGISIKTVKVHRARGMEKMHARSVAALVHDWEHAGLGTL